MKLLNRIEKHGMTAVGLIIIACLIAMAVVTNGCSSINFIP